MIHINYSVNMYYRMKRNKNRNRDKQCVRNNSQYLAVDKCDEDGNLVQDKTKDGFMTVKLLDKDGIYRTWLVHELVALTFIGPCPENHKLVHLDGDKKNNRADNLKYIKIDSTIVSTVLII
jgi:hypothetical protein